jgi:hypothetical protein
MSVEIGVRSDEGLRDLPLQEEPLLLREDDAQDTASPRRSELDTRSG